MSFRDRLRSRLGEVPSRDRGPVGEARGRRASQLTLALFSALVAVAGSTGPTQAAPYGAYLGLDARTCTDWLNHGTGGAEVSDTRMIGFPDFEILRRFVRLANVAPTVIDHDRWY